MPKASEGEKLTYSDMDIYSDHGTRSHNIGCVQRGRRAAAPAVREAGQQRLYGLDARGLRPVHDWVVGFEQFWEERLDRLNEYVKKQQKESKDDGGS
jgi:hypothetical protein